MLKVFNREIVILNLKDYEYKKEEFLEFLWIERIEVKL